MKERFNPLENEIEDLIAAGAFPGAVLCLARSGSIVRMKAFGNSVMLPEKIPARIDTIFDVASLTKPLITAAIILILIQQNKVKLETTLCEIFNSCPDDKKNISIMDLLTHRAGFPEWYPLFARGSSLGEYKDLIMGLLPLECPPQQEAIYSCLGYILLAAIIEKITSDIFLSAAEEMVIHPLGLKRTSLGKPTTRREEAAATEDSSFTEREMIREFELTYSFRSGIIWGESHDTNSFAAGGSAGNAGLFTTAAEALVLTEQFSPRSKLLQPKTLALVGNNETPFGPQHRTVGWQLASSPESSAGPDLNPNSIGHTGFTGCSVWYDCDRDVTIILLTNRVHPQVSRADVASIRRKVNSLSAQALA